MRAPVQPSANDREEFMHQIGKMFHTEGADEPERHKVSHSRTDGLMSQKGADKSGSTQNGLMSHSGKRFHTSPDTSWLPRPFRKTV